MTDGRGVEIQLGKKDQGLFLYLVRHVGGAIRKGNMEWPKLRVGGEKREPGGKGTKKFETKWGRVKKDGGSFQH